MQYYNYSYSAWVVKQFRISTPRGYLFLSKLMDFDDNYVVCLFQHNHAKWERFKKLCKWVERTRRLPGPAWSDEVWREKLQDEIERIERDQDRSRRIARESTTQPYR